MDMLHILQQWLSGFPLWEPGTLYVDYIDGVPGSMGLYPQGMEVLQRRETVLGSVSLRCRSRFAIYRITGAQEDKTAQAAWLLAFQQWVQKQSAAGQAPQLGDVPGTERLYAQKGRLEKASSDGTAAYVVSLVAEYTKNYGGNENV